MYHTHNPFSRDRVVSLKISGFPREVFALSLGETATGHSITVHNGIYELTQYVDTFADAAKAVPKIAATLLHMKINEEYIQWPI